MSFIFKQWYVMLSLIPFSGLFIFEEAKGAMLILQFFFASIGYISYLIKARVSGKLRINSFFLYLGAYVFTMVVSSLINGNISVGILFGGYVLIGMMLYFNQCIDQNPNLFAYVRNYFLILLFLNIVVYGIKPSFSMDALPGETNSYVGIFTAKNQVQMMMVPMLFFIFAGKMLNGEKDSLLDFVYVAIGIVFMILSKSSTAIVIAALAFVMIALSKKLMVSPLKMYAAYLVFVYLTVVQRIHEKYLSWLIVDYLGKDITLTGRTRIWDFVLSNMKFSPIFGFGLGQDIIARDFSVNGQPLTEAHNALIQVLLDGGFIGLCIILIILYCTYARLKKCRYKQHANVVAVFIMTYLIMGFAESIISFSRIFFWFMILIAFRLHTVTNALRTSEVRHNLYTY